MINVTVRSEIPVVSTTPASCTVVLPQRFDVHQIPQFAATTAGAGATVLTVDASQVRYIDRSGIDALIAARLHCIDEGGYFELLAPSSAARITLELCGCYECLNPSDGPVERQLQSAAAA